MAKIIKKSEVERREKGAPKLDVSGRMFFQKTEDPQPFWSKKDFNSDLPKRLKSIFKLK